MIQKDWLNFVRRLLFNWVHLFESLCILADQIHFGFVDVRHGRTLPPGKDPVPILQEAGWAPRAGLDGRKISSSPGFDPGSSSP